MKKALLATLTFFLSFSFYSQSDLIISQYIETNSGSTPKGIEIFNVSAAPITFTALNNLVVSQGQNGNPCSATGVNIVNGTIGIGEVWVIGTADLVTYATANGTDLSFTTTQAFNFNGNDALQISLGGVIQDEFGTCGVDPGANWSANGVSTQNNNIQIKDGICDGDIDGWTDPSVRFDQVAGGTDMTGFGDAPLPCGGTFVNFSVASASVNENGTSYDITVTSNATGPHTVELDEIVGGSATNGTEFSFTGPVTASFLASTTFTTSLTINDDGVCIGDHNVLFELSNASGCTIGSNSQLNLNIADDESAGGVIGSIGFEASDTWSYTPNGGGFETIDPNYYNGTQSYFFNGTQDFTSDNISIAGYSNVTLSVTFGAFNADSGEELNLDISYDNGSTWNGTGSVVLMEGFSNAILTFGQTNGSNPTTVATNPWIVNIPATETQIRVRLRADGLGATDFFYVDDIILTGDACNTCTEPTVNSVFNATTGIDNTQATLNWSVAGDGANSIVSMRENSLVTAGPVDGTTYPANAVFGTGSTLTTGEYVVYNGSANSATVTGLTAGTKYTTAVFDYNCLPGSEDYLVPASVTEFITQPEDPLNLSEVCVTDNSIVLDWDAPPSGNFQGYLLVARQGAVPGGVNALDATTQAFNLDFSAAPTYSATSKVVYRGVATQVEVTGLMEGVDYTFHLYSYAFAPTGLQDYSNPVQTSETIDQNEVTTFSGVGGNMEATVSWTPPVASCWDEVMVVATANAGIEFAPSGDGSAYTANSVFGGFNQVVFKGNTSFTSITTNLTNGVSYYFEIFVRNGTSWSSGEEIQLIPSTATVLEQGDLAIVAINTNNADTDDEVCFFAFKDIDEGTSIDFTDNGYERVNAGQWGGTEGTVRIQRSGGGPIPAGQTICVIGEGNGDANTTTGVEDFQVFVCGVDDSANWIISSLNGNFNFNLNGSDQLWMMQNGTWTGGLGAHNGNYSGNILYGWTATGWEAAPGYVPGTDGSTLYPGNKCLSSDIDGLANADKVKYTGDLTATSQIDWLDRINNSANWTGYADNTAFDGAPVAYDYANSCVQFSINSSGLNHGVWTGAVNTDWFNCENWSGLQVPNSTTDVVLDQTQLVNVANNSVNIDRTEADAFYYDFVAATRNLDILENMELNILSNLDELTIHQNLGINANSNVNDRAILRNAAGGSVEVIGGLVLTGAFSVLDLASPVGVQSTLTLRGLWLNNNLNEGIAPNVGFLETNSKVVFAGGNDQNMDGLVNEETFHDIAIEKTVGSSINMVGGTNLRITNELSFTGGYINAFDNSSMVIVTNDDPAAITGFDVPNGTGTYSQDRFIYGRLSREVLAGNTYVFPIGDRPDNGTTQFNSYQPVTLTPTLLSGAVEGEFLTGSAGNINLYDNTLFCNGMPRVLNYNNFAHQGFWNLEGPAGMEYQITLHPNATNNIEPAASNGEFRILKAPGGTGGGSWPNNSSAYDTDYCATTPYYNAAASFTGFSDFGIVLDPIDPAVLPIELLSFSAKKVDNDVQLNWITATEINNDYFTLFHSTDGIDWKEIGTVDGAGNSQENLSYNFKHNRPGWGLHYYKLKQTDFDGTYTFSDLEVVEIGSSSDLIVYPIPSRDLIFVEGIGELDVKNLVIHNDQGQAISNWSYSRNQIDISEIPDGVYFIAITGLKDTVYKKFIKVSR